MDAVKRIIFAADIGSLQELRAYLKVFKGEIGIIKLGMELLMHSLLTGEPIFQTVLKESDFQIMFDMKFGDIPATVAGAAKEVAKYGQGRIFGFTVHCSAGKNALEKAVQAVTENFPPESNAPPYVIGVTLLTSLDQSDLAELGIKGAPTEVVSRWAEIASNAKVPAIVCSSKETRSVLMVNPALTVINPGIRFADSDLGTQKRVTTPKDAFLNGAAYVVMGSDLRKGDPVANARRAAAEIEIGLAQRQ